MANRRMFLKEIVESDPFVTMPPSAQALYFHLCMNADDDGFLNSPIKIQRGMGANEEDLSILKERRFILSFEKGVIVIKHWRMQNTLRKDRYTPTQYQEIFQNLTIKENGAYTESGNQTATRRQPDGEQPLPQVSLGKGSVGKGSKVNVPIPSHPTLPETDCSFSDEKECRTKNVRRKDVQQVIDAWNETGLKQIERITPESKRGEMTRKRIRDYGLDKVLEAVSKVKTSKFLCGENEKGWYATYDWFILPSNFQKVLEGNYDDRNRKEESKTNNPFLKILEEDYGQG